MKSIQVLTGLAELCPSNGESNTPTKENEVLAALVSGSLNRFEAERIGDHCLNSTVAILRNDKGIAIVDHWETVPSRGARGESRVKRYRVDRSPENLSRARALLGVGHGIG